MVEVVMITRSHVVLHHAVCVFVGALRFFFLVENGKCESEAGGRKVGNLKSLWYNTLFMYVCIPLDMNECTYSTELLHINPLV